ncbi:MAG: hypothetical protein E5Y63_16380 [Mesorhizobium sp.]|nr:MAG: hypothetical protein EOR08_04320 [Mesorhizobium sp.]TIM29166.1 MAG: hypothetical protein E5Y63_16380 [Mesorhizobium sp.]
MTGFFNKEPDHDPSRSRCTPISPLRQRLIGDMNMWRFSRETQRNYLRPIRICVAARARRRRCQPSARPARSRKKARSPDRCLGGFPTRADVCVARPHRKTFTEPVI